MKSKNRSLTFTDHQLTILKTWSKVNSIDKVATELGISEHTVQTHLKRLRKKLGVRRTFEVYLYLVQHGHLEIVENSQEE